MSAVINQSPAKAGSNPLPRFDERPAPIEMAGFNPLPRFRKQSVADVVARFDELPDSARVALPVVMALFGIGRSTGWRWAKDGTLPKPQNFGGSARWRVGDLRRALGADCDQVAAAAAVPAPAAVRVTRVG